MDWWMKCLMCKHEDENLDPQTPYKGQVAQKPGLCVIFVGDGDRRMLGKFAS